MKKLALVAVVALLAVGCATTGVHEKALEASAGGVGGAAIQSARVGDVPGAQAAAARDLANGASTVAREANNENVVPAVQKGVANGRDGETSLGGGQSGTPVGPKGKVHSGSIPGKMEKAMLTVQLLMNRGKGGEADEGFNADSIQKVKKAVDDTTSGNGSSMQSIPDQMERMKLTVQLLMKRGKGSEADEGFNADSIEKVKKAVGSATSGSGSGRPNAQDSLKQGIEKVNLLMKRGKGCVADEGFSSYSIKSVDRQVSGGSKAQDGKESIRDQVTQYTRRSVSKDCGSSRCKE